MGIKVQPATNKDEAPKQSADNISGLQKKQDSKNHAKAKALHSSNFIPPIKKSFHNGIWNNLSLSENFESKVSKKNTSISEKTNFVIKKYLNQEYARTLSAIQAIIEKHGSQSINTDLLLRVYIDSLYKAQKHEQLLLVVDQYSLGKRLDSALYYKTKIFNKNNKKELAISTYLELVRLFPQSDYADYINTEIQLTINEK